MITIMSDEAHDQLHIFDSIVTEPEKFRKKMFVRFLGTDQVYYYYEDSQYVFYTDPHFSNLHKKISFEISKDKTTITVQYWKDDTNSTEPTVVTKFKFDNKKKTYVELWYEKAGGIHNDSF